MNPETVSLLCSPGSHELLRLTSSAGPDGRIEQVLTGVDSGATFQIRDGIPLLLDESHVAGPNLRYQRLYNRIAGLYDGSINIFATMVGGGEERFRREYLRELDIEAGDRVLEVSVGTGANLRYLPSAAYFGVDISWGMLRKCQRNLGRWQLEAELILGNAEELPLRSESFDSVLHVGGINAFSDRGKAIHEMTRVARTGAKIVIVDETAKMMEWLAWAPSVRKWLDEYRDRFAAPVGLVPEGMKEIQERTIAKGNLYCLTFRKPES